MLEILYILCLITVRLHVCAMYSKGRCMSRLYCICVSSADSFASLKTHLPYQLPFQVKEKIPSVEHSCRTFCLSETCVVPYILFVRGLWCPSYRSIDGREYEHFQTPASTLCCVSMTDMVLSIAIEIYLRKFCCF